MNRLAGERGNKESEELEKGLVIRAREMDLLVIAICHDIRKSGMQVLGERGADLVLMDWNVEAGGLEEALQALENGGLA